MYDDGFLTDGVMIEWLKSHTNVIYQPPVGHKAYSGLNPYALGFAMYTDIQRICEAPTEEDRAWFPDIAGSPGCRHWTTRCATSRTRASSAST
jgi:stage V sporulation protein R